MDTVQLHHLGLVYAAYLIAVASPGPSTMAIMSVAMNQGRGPAVVLALGVVTGSLFWALLAAAGISTVLTAFAGGMLALKIAGGLYLLFLAIKSGRSALAPGNGATRTFEQAKPMVLYRRGLLLHLTNPKSILGWIAIMTLGLGPGASHMTLAAILAGCAFLGLLVFVGYALLFSTSVMARTFLRCRRWVEGTLAVVFGTAGLRLLFSKP
ncbi:threonine/homoserine/homoserine lactone efflux protein [Rhizobium sp. PP-F2F-G48]|uniref:LysE family translocator n=1 Tax=Rhizobium sp. PP-F2F-G48 TaxID=2135651 RepID=UPI00104C50DF|nr:LysE family translocator [Rhizobium sp. PP-F2F-G48]TCM55982.1 threonine/homoserine/homoserine lactone efflux protein [Rhizobium sp. PP-F2F-G48]